MSERTSLSHGVLSSRNCNKNDVAVGVTDGKSVFIWTCVEHCNIDSSHVLDDGHQISEWLVAKVMVVAEFLGEESHFGLGGHQDLGMA
jgi:hypothetical protein